MIASLPEDSSDEDNYSTDSLEKCVSNNHAKGEQAKILVDSLLDDFDKRKNSTHTVDKKDFVELVSVPYYSGEVLIPFRRPRKKTAKKSAQKCNLSVNRSARPNVFTGHLIKKESTNVCNSTKNLITTFLNKRKIPTSSTTNSEMKFQLKSNTQDGTKRISAADEKYRDSPTSEKSNIHLSNSVLGAVDVGNGPCLSQEDRKIGCTDKEISKTAKFKSAFCASIPRNPDFNYNGKRANRPKITIKKQDSNSYVEIYKRYFKDKKEGDDNSASKTLSCSNLSKSEVRASENSNIGNESHRSLLSDLDQCFSVLSLDLLSENALSTEGHSSAYDISNTSMCSQRSKSIDPCFCRQSGSVKEVRVGEIPDHKKRSKSYVPYTFKHSPPNPIMGKLGPDLELIKLKQEKRMRQQAYSEYVRQNIAVKYFKNRKRSAKQKPQTSSKHLTCTDSTCKHEETIEAKVGNKDKGGTRKGTENRSQHTSRKSIIRTARTKKQDDNQQQMSKDKCPSETHHPPKLKSFSSTKETPVENVTTEINNLNERHLQDMERIKKIEQEML